MADRARAGILGAVTTTARGMVRAARRHRPEGRHASPRAQRHAARLARLHPAARRRAVARDQARHLRTFGAAMVRAGAGTPWDFLGTLIVGILLRYCPGQRFVRPPVREIWERGPRTLAELVTTITAVRLTIRPDVPAALPGCDRRALVSTEPARGPNYRRNLGIPAVIPARNLTGVGL